LESAERGFLHGSLWSAVIVGGNAYEVVTAEQAFAKEAGKNGEFGQTRPLIRAANGVKAMTVNSAVAVVEGWSAPG
jgi:hypothetical protein